MIRMWNVRRESRNAYSSAIRIAVVLTFWCVASVSALWSQTAQYSPVQTTLNSSFQMPAGVAVDARGNLFVADLGNGSGGGAAGVYEVLAAGGYSTVNQLASGGGFYAAARIAVDGSGNVYVADKGDGTGGHHAGVYEILASGGYATVNQLASGGGFYAPSGIAIDGSGDVFVADYGNGLGGSHAGVYEISGATVTQLAASAGFQAPTGAAVDASGNVFVADYGNGTGSNHAGIYEISGTTVTQLATSAGFQAPDSIAVDATDNIFVADRSKASVFEVLSAGSYAVVNSLGSGLSSPMGVALDWGDNVYVADSGNSRVVEFELQAANLGAVQVGSSSSPVLVTFTFNSSVSLNSATPYQVLTQGATGLDFTVTTGSTGNCSGSYGSGDSCSVSVTFSPQLAGTRYGAVVLYGSSGPIAAANIFGTGTGPQLTFNPGTQAPVATGMETPWSVTVDASGNLYVPLANGGTVVKLTPSAGSYSQTTVASGLNTPRGVAVDGSGNVFIACSAAVVKATPSNGSYTQSTIVNGATNGVDYNLVGIAVDPFGNLYTASYTDGGDGTVYKVAPSNGAYIQTAIGSGYVSPVGVAVDGSGNVFVTEYGGGKLDKLSPVNSSFTQTTIDSGFTNPEGVAVDASGNLYISSTATPTLYKETPTSGGGYVRSAIATNITPQPWWSTIDGNGNLYFTANNSEASDGVYEIEVANPPSLTFASTNVGSTSSDSPQTVSVLNIGNLPLEFSTPASGANPSYPVDFPENSSDSNLCASGIPLAASGSCDISVDFTPTNANNGSPFNTSVVLTDNALNVVNATQSISVSGIAVGITLSPSSLTNGTGTVGVAYGPATFTASGCTSNQCTFSSTGLPGGLSLNSTSGDSAALSGTPTAAGTFTFTVTVMDSGSLPQSSETYTITISAGTPTVSWSTAPPASAAYNSQFTVAATSNSTGAITYSTIGGCSNNLGVVTMTSGTTACQVSASAAADANYTTGSVGPTSVTASLANQPTPTVNVSSPATYNTQQTLTTTGGSGTGPVTYSVGASTACTVSGATLSITSGTGSCSVTATKAADSNCNSATSAAAPVTVQLAITIVTTLPTASAITYGQLLSSSTLMGGSATPSAGSFEWTTPTAVPLAGTQSESVIFVPTDTADYSSSAPGTVNVTVNPASFIVTVSSDDSGTASNCTPQTTPGTGSDSSCSLRDALLEAAATGGGNITFDAMKFAGATTITLGNGTLNLPSVTTIAGPTTGSGASLANLVTVDGNGAATVFTVSSGVTGASIANLIIQHGNGGGIQNAGALVLAADTITGNTATGAGGGIGNSGTLVLSASTLSGNTAGGSGGGIGNSGTLTLSDDTISGNSASGTGGGIYNSATLMVSDSTLSGNTAATASGGGGIDNAGSGTAALANTILSGNSANSSADDFDGVAYTDNGGNVVGVISGTTVNGTAIALAPLGSYGGATQTLIPLPGSPAICAGVAGSVPSGVTTDQRGLPNTNTGYPSYSTCVDAGAVQTSYALSFTTQPSSVSVATNFAAAVTLNESGNPFQPAVTIPLTLNGSGTLTGGSAATSAGVANYTLKVDTAASSDTLTANLTLNSGLAPAVAISTTSNSFAVGTTTLSVGLSLSSASVTYGTLVTMTATLPSPATGSVTFYNNGSVKLGSGTLSGGVATFSSSTLAAGSYSVTAAYLGDSNYNAATSSPQSLTVNQATPTINWSAPSAITYGTALSGTQLNATATFNGNTVAGTFAYNPPSGTMLGAGSQTLKVTFTPTDATDYTTGTGQVTLTVNQAVLTVTANNASRTYGAANPAFTVSYAGFVNGDTQSVLSGSPSLTTTATVSSPVGNYTITAAAGTLSATNYSFTFVNGTLTVNQAVLDVTANNATRVYGTANPAFTGSVTGAVNSDTFTESFSTSATLSSNAGTYAVVPSATGTDLADYSVTVQNGTLTITQAGTTTSMSVSSGSITPGQSVTLTATDLSATTGTPTGSVNFYDGTSLLDTAPLSGGMASFATTTLSAGTTHQLTAVYSGDVNFVTSSTSSSTPIIVASLDFTVTASAPTSQTVNAGGAAAYQMVVAPLYGTYPASVTFAATGLPTGATATFSPTSIAANGGQQTVTMTVQTPATTASRQAVPRPSAFRGLQPLTLAFLLLLGIGGMRRHGRNLRRVFYLALLLIGGATTLMTGCGGYTKSTTQTPETYTITVTATSGNVQHSTTFMLTVE
jgi:sugar lactone lactonase YvrE